MPLSTEQRRNLVQLINQLSQNVSNDAGSNFLSNLPGLDINLDISLGNRDTDDSDNNDTPEESGSPDTPATIRDALQSLQNEQVEVTVPFGTVSGTLLAVRDNYIVIVEDNGSQVLVQLDKIELVSE